MEELINQERFEMEVLDHLNTRRLLPSLVFYGGTMLRLCHGLDRFSVDLDFRLRNPAEAAELFGIMEQYLNNHYTIKDAADKFHTLLFELGSNRYHRKLKIEIRKKGEDFAHEPMIAYSPYSDVQVLLEVMTLEEMMRSKIAAFLDRGEVRDAYDIEFLIKKGVEFNVSEKTAEDIKRQLNALSKQDYTTKLSPLIQARLRPYYLKNGFRILQEKLDSGTW